jgi:hypothetical protein
LLSQISEWKWEEILHHREDTEFKKHFLNSIIYILEGPIGKEDRERKEIFDVLNNLIDYELIEPEYLGFKFCVL